MNGSPSHVRILCRIPRRMPVRHLELDIQYSRKMDTVEDVRIKPCTESKYVQPYRVLYKQNGTDVLWDCVKMHDSLAILIYNKTRNAFVIVKQFRPAVYMNKNRSIWENSSVFPNALSQKSSTSASSAHPPSKKRKLNLTDKSAAASDNSPTAPATWGPACEGCTYELCAGIVDKDLPLEHIAKEEILEETGYDVPPEALERITSYCSNIGTGGNQQYLFYCEVTDDMLASSGGGNQQEGELIEVVYIPAEESIKTVLDDSVPKSSSLCFGFFWFDKYKRPQLNT